MSLISVTEVTIHKIFFAIFFFSFFIHVKSKTAATEVATPKNASLNCRQAIKKRQV
jgi:hypothetical protein